MTDRPLLGRSVYVARPIDITVATPERDEVVSRVEAELIDAGAVIYNPAHAFGVPAGVAPYSFIQDVNREVIMRVDAVVGLFPELSIGVPMELQLGTTFGKALGIYSEKADVSWALAGLEAVNIAGGTFRPWTEELAAEIDRHEERGPIDDKLMYVGAPQFAPKRGHDDDAGFDLFVAEEMWIPYGEVRDVPCGCSLALPPGVWGLVLGRSSTIRKHHLTVNPAVIDGGYRGSMFVAVHNTGKAGFRAEVGMRLGQIIPLPNVAETLEAMAVGALPPGSRGDAGFGSTGI